MPAPRKLDAREQERVKSPIAKKVKAQFTDKKYWDFILRDIDPDTGRRMTADSPWLPPDMLRSLKRTPDPTPKKGAGAAYGTRGKRGARGKSSSTSTKKSSKKSGKRKSKRKKKGRSAAQKAATARMLAARFGGDRYESFTLPRSTSTAPAASSRTASTKSTPSSNLSRPYIGPNY